MSNKIIIIGNGFDLAHGYETDYFSFIHNLFKESIVDNSANEEIFRFEEKDISAFSDGQIKINSINKFIRTKNNFFAEIVSEIENKNWSDIEELYFKRLNNTKEPNIDRLNEEFEVVKKRLERYLTDFIKYEKPISCYANFFKKHNRSTTVILNFNYTQTIQNLYNVETSNCEIINIHGELNSIKCPIIFGYAASFDENNVLLDRNNSQYLINIKAYNYKRTNIETRLNEIYEESKFVEYKLFLVGHSCSLSDRNILNQLFNLKRLNKINILYYKNFDNYRNTLINVHRIMESKANYGQITSFDDSLSAPQFDDNEKQKEIFISKLK